MSALAVRYKGLTLRPALPADNDLAMAWAAEDPFHAWANEQPYYWVQQKEKVLSCVMEDGQGPVFFLQMITRSKEEMDLNIQFAPAKQRAMRRRILRAMTTGFEGLSKNLSFRGFKAVYFGSESNRLIDFAVRRLGFVKDGERYRFELATAATKE